MKRILAILAVSSMCMVGMAQQLEEKDFFDPNKKKQVEQPWQFGVEWRIEAGYIQPNQHSKNKTYANLYLHGARLGATADFILPKHFSLQTGLIYSIAYGKQTQSWGPMNYEDQYARQMTVTHRVLEHQLTIPVRAYYNIHVVKKFHIFFYTGPQLNIGLAQKDDLRESLTDQTKAWMATRNIPYEPYDRYKAGELNRANIQWGVGGGFEWDAFRLQAGYDFGLNNLVKNKLTPDQHLWEWGWFVSFAYRL